MVGNARTNSSGDSVASAMGTRHCTTGFAWLVPTAIQEHLTNNVSVTATSPYNNWILNLHQIAQAKAQHSDAGNQTTFLGRGHLREIERHQWEKHAESESMQQSNDNQHHHID